MPKQVSNVNVSAPGYWGLNTEDSPTQLPPQFASIADNCVIDKKGRIAARKGFEYVTTSGGTSSTIKSIFNFIEDDGTETVFSAGANKIYTGTTTLSDATPGGATISADNWQFAQLNEELFMFQSGHAPMMYDPDVGSVQLITNHSGYTGTVKQGDTVLAAFGRLWVSGVAGDLSTVYWSDLLNGAAWAGGSAGSIDLEEYWPRGYDEVVALHEWNDFLVIFGKKSIFLYQGAQNPASMVLHDVINGIGCVARDSIQPLGDDLVFLEASGLRSLGRVIQEKSNPITFLSRNVNSDIKNATSVETGKIKSLYCRVEAFYLLSFPSQNTVYCFDIRSPLQDGSLKTTKWVDTNLTALYVLPDCTVYAGGTNGILSYTADYTDEGAEYPMRFYTHPLDFGQPSVLKILKEVDMAMEGGNSYTVALKWAVDYTSSYRTSSTTTGAGTAAEFNIAEYSIGEYGGGAGVASKHLKIGGTGRKVTIGVEVDINTAEFAIQEMNIHAILGRIE